jgi:hypothetical protein
LRGLVKANTPSEGKFGKNLPYENIFGQKSSRIITIECAAFNSFASHQFDVFI